MPVVVALCAAVVGAGCAPEPLGPPAPSFRVQLSTEALAFVAVGDTQAVTASVVVDRPVSVPGGSFSWESADEGIARVLADGPSGAAVRVIAVGPGRTEVVVRSPGADSARLQVDVTQVPVQVSVAALGAPVLFEVGAQRNAAAVVRDARAHVISGVAVTWESTAPDVATVSGTGVITAVAAGGTEIVAVAGALRSPPLPIEVLVGAPLAPAPAVTFVGAESAFCGIAASGVTHCWGRGAYGRLGNGATADAVDPVPVNGGHAFVTLSAGRGGPCGITADGAAHCWGGNYGLPFDAEPVARATGVRTFVRHYGWYSSPGPYGGMAGPSTSLGYANSGLRSDGILIGANGSGPGMIAALRFARVVAEESRACGIVVNGSLYCWPQRAVSGADEFERPFGAGRFRAVTFEYDHRCALTDDGVAVCVGDNSRGQLGDGSAAARTAPAPVSGALRFTEIVAGFRYTCALAADGAVYCWGLNDAGQLGDGSLVDRRVPTRVAGDLTFAALAPSSPSCALTADGAAYCWGMPAPAGAPEARITVPTRVAAPMTFRLP